MRSMLTVNGARCTNQHETANKQGVKQLTNGYFIQMDLQEPQYLSTVTRVSNSVEENVFFTSSRRLAKSPLLKDFTG